MKKIIKICIVGFLVFGAFGSVYAESFNSNYKRIVFMDGYVYLEQLPKGKF